MKTCTSCAETKALSDFYASVTGAPMSACKDCHKSAVRKRRRMSPAAREYDRKRAKTPERKAKARAITKRFRSKDPMAAAAQRAVAYAMREGRMQKEPCLFCGATEHIHAHHRDYAKPLEVVWLCAKCHHRLHATFPETAAHERKAA